LEHLRALSISVIIIIAVDTLVSSDILRLLAWSYVVFIAAYATKDYFDADPYALASGIEAAAFVSWVLLSIFWNTVIARIGDSGTGYVEAITTQFFIPGLIAALGCTFALATIQTFKDIAR
jgi:hypothetical protein